MFVNEEPIDVVIMDPAGQERYMELTKNYFQTLDAIVLVFDMTKASSFEGVLRWFRQITEAKDCPILIVGNKADKITEIILSPEEINEISNYCMVPVYQASAYKGTGVDDCFMAIIQMAYTR